MNRQLAAHRAAVAPGLLASLALAASSDIGAQNAPGRRPNSTVDPSPGPGSPRRRGTAAHHAESDNRTTDEEGQAGRNDLLRIQHHLQQPGAGAVHRRHVACDD